MATAVAQDGITVTPSGILQGRDAIRRNLQDVSGTARLLDPSHAKQGDQPLRGFDADPLLVMAI